MDDAARTATSPTFGGLRLLPEDELVVTGPVDHASWNYRGVLGWIQRRRFRLVQRLLGGDRFGSLLEIGYGSGVFAPTLASHCDRYWGLDVHDRASEVRGVLRDVGVEAELRQGSVTHLPFESGTFDCVVAVSTLEFVDDHDRACREVSRVLRPGGVFLVVTPGHSPILDLGLLVFTGESASKDFEGRREGIVPALVRTFRVVDQLDFPPLLPGLRVYRSFRLSRIADPV